MKKKLAVSLVLTVLVSMFANIYGGEIKASAGTTVQVRINLPEDLDGFQSGYGTGYDTAGMFALPDHEGTPAMNDSAFRTHAAGSTFDDIPGGSSYSESIDLHYPRNENYMQWNILPADSAHSSDINYWKWVMWSDDGQSFIDDWNGMRDKEITIQDGLIYGSTFTVTKTKDINGNLLPKPVQVTIKGSDLSPAATYLHSWRTYPQQGANANTENLWTSHPSTSFLRNYKLKTTYGKFLAYYTYCYTIHYTGVQTVDLSRGTINYYYKDLDGNTLSASDQESDLDISSGYDVNTNVSSKQKSISGYTYQYVDISAPTLSSSTTTANVTYYYKKNDSGGGSNPVGGDLSFNPPSTNWTNQGKIAEGVGSYPVNVSYTGQNPALGIATVTWNHNEPVPDKEETTTSGTPPVTTTIKVPQPPIVMTHDGTFPINYPLSSITVSGAASGSFGGTGGTVNITQQGSSLQLSGNGQWGAVVQEAPAAPDSFDTQGGTVIPPAPNNPQGNSGIYQLDWTKPVFNISSRATTGWSKVPYNFNYSLTDSLSGVRNGTYSLVDSSYYGRSQSGNANSKSFTLQDGIYNFGIAFSDNANNSGNDTAGTYYVDTIKPTDTISPRSTSNQWVTSPFTFNYSLADNLSGVAYGNYSISDSSHYGRSQSGSSTGTSFTLNDGIYNFGLNFGDVATNTNSDSSGTYYVDTISPTVSFNVSPGIFSTSRGAVRKPSTHGVDDGFFGNISVNDNMSGIARLDYGWSYGSSSTGVNYTTIYTSPYTLNDRYNETITREVEKPVGDNLYLHVRLWDTAGNYTYQSFGAYEDPIKLRGFRITDVRDPNWSDVFWSKDLKTSKNVSYSVDKLPIGGEWGDNPVYLNAKIKKGYAFYFDVTSEYLYRDNDRIEVIPTLYYWDGTTRTPVDMYYMSNNNPFIKVGSAKDTLQFHMKPSSGTVSIGNLSRLTLRRQVRLNKGSEWSSWRNTLQYSNGKEQWWYGKYFIPDSAIFTRVGQSPRPENLLKGKGSFIIVNFQIVAYKNGVETSSTDQTFTYVPTQWAAEGGPKAAKYRSGDVVLYDNLKSALDDLEVRTIH